MRRRGQVRGGFVRRALTLLIVACVGAAPAPALAQEPPREPRPGGYDLRRVLALADQNHPNIAQAKARLAQVRAQLDEAHFTPFFSQFKMTGGLAVAPTVRGNNLFSPNTDVSLTSSMGVGWRMAFEGVIPLWTFGKITSAWDAAEANVRLNKAMLDRDRDAVRLDVREAYFGLQLARDTALLLAEARGHIDKALTRLQGEVDSGEGDPIEFLKLQTYSAELEAREAEVARYIDVALAGLRFYTGVAGLDIPDEPLRPPRHQLGHVTRYLTAARLYRPEIAMATAGVEARSAQVQMARSMLFPDIGLALSAGFSTAPEVADQINPYVLDPGNRTGVGFALAFQWKLDLLSQAARIRYAEAQLEEVRAQQRFALGGVGAEIEKTYAEVVDWKKRFDAYSKAVSYARRWLVTVQQGIDVGTMQESDLLDPARSYATQKFNMLNAMKELDMAMSRLAKSTGWDAIAPDGN